MPRDDIALPNGTVVRKELVSFGWILTITTGKIVRSFSVTFDEADALVKLLGANSGVPPGPKKDQ